MKLFFLFLFPLFNNAFFHNNNKLNQQPYFNNNRRNKHLHIHEMSEEECDDFEKKSSSVQSILRIGTNKKKQTDYERNLLFKFNPSKLGTVLMAPNPNNNNNNKDDIYAFINTHIMILTAIPTMMILNYVFSESH